MIIAVKQTTDGGYIISGNYYDYDVLILKTDSSGDSLWTKIISTSDGRWEKGESVQETSDGGYIIAGWTYVFRGFYYDPDVLLIKIAPEVTSVKENPQVFINGYQLQQNYPNPFNPSTTIEFSLPQSDFVTLKVYNILGEEVATLVSEKLNAGEYKYNWDAGALASGMYLYRIQAGDYVESKKMILLR